MGIPESDCGLFTFLPAKDEDGWLAQERSRESLCALQQENAFFYYRHAPSTRYGVTDIHTYHCFYVKFPSRSKPDYPYSTLCMPDWKVCAPKIRS